MAIARYLVCLPSLLQDLERGGGQARREGLWTMDTAVTLPYLFILNEDWEQADCPKFFRFFHAFKLGSPLAASFLKFL